MSPATRAASAVLVGRRPAVTQENPADLLGPRDRELHRVVVLGAIHHATGVRMTRVPATPDRVLAAIKSKNE